MTAEANAAPSDPLLRHRPMRAAWVIAAAAILVDVAAVTALGLSLPMSSTGLLVGVSGGMFALAWVYTHVRPDRRIASGASAAGFLVLLTMLLAVSSYIGIALAFPLWDARFAALDGWLGFDWTAHLAYVVERPLLARVLALAYHSSLIQPSLVVVALSASGRDHRLQQFLLLFASTATIVIVVSTLMPAAGAYAWHQPPEALLAALRDPEAGRWHLADFRGLRDGTLLTIPVPHVQGLISFPSFHTALALVTVWALRPVRWVAAPALVVNSALIVATLTIGGHYLVDVLGGALVAGVSIALVARVYAEERTSRPALVTSEVEAAPPLERAA